MKKTKTSRGLELISFKDHYKAECSLQQSSTCSSEENPNGCIWLGIDKPDPKIMKSQALEHGLKLVPGEERSGWMPYPIPEDVLLNTRMHLNERQVKELIKHLQNWLDTGSF